MKPLVIYHGNCADGFAAAWVFHHKFGQGHCEFYPGVYNENPPYCGGRDVYLVDFSYSREITAIIVDEAASVTLIDHHKTAIEALEGLPGLTCYVDVERSGARLAWDFLYGTAEGNPEPPPMLLHVEDRDLWRFALPMTREIQSNVFSHPYTFEVYDKLMQLRGLDLAEFASAGAAINRKQAKDLDELLPLFVRTMAIGLEVPVASLPYTMASEAGQWMYNAYPDAPFVATYYDTAGHRVFSLRSQKGKEDVSAIAKKYGGGGHANAAGFRVPRDHPLAQA